MTSGEQRVLVVFDLDGTLTAVRSIESAFIGYLLRRGRIPLSNLLALAAFFISNSAKGTSVSIKKNKKYLRNISMDTVEGWIEDFLHDLGPILLDHERMKLVLEHRKAGHATVLLTGTFDRLSEALGLGSIFDRIYATSYEHIDGRYTGCVSGVHYCGESKALLTRNLFEDFSASPEHSYCYADSKNDMQMMRLFGNPVAVRPDNSLRKTASELGWKIID